MPGKQRLVLKASLVLLLAATMVAGVALASGFGFDGIERVSVPPSGGHSTGISQLPAISGNGHFVAFLSDADNLVPNDTNQTVDVFLFDREKKVTRRVNVSSSGEQANGYVLIAPISISAAGRYVAFSSMADNLVPDDNNDSWDVFVHDLEHGTTRRASAPQNAGKFNSGGELAALSSDGRYVAFTSHAPILASDRNNVKDLYVRDMTTSEVIRASVATTGQETNAHVGISVSISADGRFILFESAASNLVADDTNAAYDVFVRDRQNGTTSRVSIGRLGQQGNAPSIGASISADGRFVAFNSLSSNLVPGDTDDSWDVFLHDRVTGETTAITLASDLLGKDVENGGYGENSWPSLNGDGRLIAFASPAGNIVPDDDRNATWDVFVYDRTTTKLTRVTDAKRDRDREASAYPVLSADGSFLAFGSSLAGIVPGYAGLLDIFVYDLTVPILDPPPAGK